MEAMIHVAGRTQWDRETHLERDEILTMIEASPEASARWQQALQALAEHRALMMEFAAEIAAHSNLQPHEVLRVLPS